MRHHDADTLAAVLDYGPLVGALRDAFTHMAPPPLRSHYEMGDGRGGDATLLVMPAWQPGVHVGVKVVSVIPANQERGLATINGTYLLIDGETGLPRATLDGATLTRKRTAGVSALAADFLARDNASTLLMVGNGALAPELIRAHAAVRDLKEVRVWGRSHDKARAVAAGLKDLPFPVTPVDKLEPEVAWADTISCATLSEQPLIHGDWLKPGQHLDLVGSFKPHMREADDAAVRRSRVFVDTREGACKETGDIVQPLESGALLKEEIAADLFDLCAAGTRGRGSAEEITFFKSVGTAVADLGTAVLAESRVTSSA